MALLENYSENGTYILVTQKGYSVIKADKNEVKNGLGGFNERKELLGIYVLQNKLFFQYNDKVYQTEVKELLCKNIFLKDKTRQFTVTINGEIVCDINYKPYISPLALAFEEDDDEFDFLLYLSRIMQNEETLNNFIKGMNV